MSLLIVRQLRASIVRRNYSTIKRAKPIRVKKSESRRVIPKASKQTDALTEVPTSHPPANPFTPFEQQTPQPIGGVLKESFLWGMGMAAAFSVVGIIFSNMEGTTIPGKFTASSVVSQKKLTQ
ncbi:hypothetical protein CCR75_002079 [Bremia lactucae]|uniref:Uncharacterized protein n=1 Tax=Bremia lactucae TaxID=4779 RepID=A0A976IJL3_BRELC|nr:hypothetical protein CCR75_002076 [Bremia lactucae]TDH72984.1 hypothetical protein CCR75_002079 [Bremia lactucae]